MNTTGLKAGRVAGRQIIVSGMAFVATALVCVLLSLPPIWCAVSVGVSAGVGALVGVILKNSGAGVATLVFLLAWAALIGWVG